MKKQTLLLLTCGALLATTTVHGMKKESQKSNKNQKTTYLYYLSYINPINGLKRAYRWGAWGASYLLPTSSDTSTSNDTASSNSTHLRREKEKLKNDMHKIEKKRSKINKVMKKINLNDFLINDFFDNSKSNQPDALEKQINNLPDNNNEMDELEKQIVNMSDDEDLTIEEELTKLEEETK